jgi:broad specificity phosphatase PhoE
VVVTRVIFIRPGETDWNRLIRWQGWVASPLNEHGRRQVQQLANYIRHIGIKVLYTSDLRRALETAALLSEKLGFPAIPDERLRERNIGEWQGLTIDEMRSWFPTEYRDLLLDAENFRVPGGESRQDVCVRMRAAFDDIVEQANGETIGIISHTTAIHALLDELIPDNASKEVSVSNTSVTTIARKEDGSWQLVAADDVMHLDGLEAQQSPELEDEQ